MQTAQTPQAGAFATTHWTVVLSARDQTNPAAPDALAQLCQTYWPPLFAFLRRGGHPPADAEDLVQGFFEQLLARESLRQVAREKGRFRSFLLKSLQNHVANQGRDRRTQRRGGGQTHLRLEDPVWRGRCEQALQTGGTSAEVFDRVWAQTTMAAAAAALRREYEQSGRAALYAVVHRWLAAEARPGDYAAAAPSIGLTEGALAAAVFRLRQRFRQLIRQEIAHTVQSPLEVDEELRHLLKVLLHAPPA
jgi:DNA-directed RNA polymerase specialized sigma24 family protein